MSRELLEQIMKMDSKEKCGGKSFTSLKKKLARKKGIKSPGGLAAFIKRKKLGKTKGRKKGK